MPLLSPLAGLLVVALAIYGVGWLAARAVVRGETPFEGRCVLGLATWVAVLFVLAATGSLHAAVVQWTVAAGGLLGVLAVLAASTDASPPRPARLVATGLATVPLVLVLAITVNPTVSWDGAVYHLTLPSLYLQAGGFRTVPLLVYSLWPQAVELLFGLGLAVHGYVLAKAMHFGFGVLTAALLVRHGGVRRPAAGLLAAALFLFNDVVLFELRAAYVDLAAACFALLAFLLLERTLDEPSVDAGSRHLALAGAACGLLAATKVTGIVSAACLAALLLPRWLQASRRTRLRMAATFALPLLVLWLPWLVRSWLVTGNPVYPLLWQVFGGADWSARLGEQLVAWQRSIGMGRQPSDYLLLPWRVLTAGGYGYQAFDGSLSPGWLPLLPLALWRGVGSPRARRALGVAALLFATWALGSQQMRFLIPALPLLALAVADGVDGALDRLRLAWRTWPVARLQASRFASGLVIAAWLLAFATIQPRLMRAGWSHLRLYADPDFAMPERPPRPPVFDAIAELPNDATVLLLNSNQLFHCQRACVADSFFEASQIADWLGRANDAEEAARWLHGRGVSHLAWSGQPLGVRYPQPLQELLRRPELARPVFVRGADRLWQLETVE